MLKIDKIHELLTQNIDNLDHITLALPIVAGVLCFTIILIVLYVLFNVVKKSLKEQAKEDENNRRLEIQDRQRLRSRVLAHNEAMMKIRNGS